MPISHVLLLLTYRCNLHCDFCLSYGGYWECGDPRGLPQAVSPVRYLRGGAKEEMTTAKIVGRVIPQCEAASVQVVALSGGEVLVRKDARTVFRALGESALRWCLYSNMMLCDETTAAAIVSARCDRVFVSLDGRSEVHNRLRGNLNAFERTEQGLYRLAAASRKVNGGLVPVSINFVLQLGNEAEAPHLIRLAAGFGAEELSIQLLSHSVYTDPFDVACAADALEEAHAVAADLGVTVLSFPLTSPSEADLSAWFSSPVDGRFFSGCDYISTNLMIDPRGDVIPCLEVAVGNVLTEDLAEIWNGLAYEGFRQRVAEQGPLPACMRCCNLNPSPTCLLPYSSALRTTCS